MTQGIAAIASNEELVNRESLLCAWDTGATVMQQEAVRP